MSIGPFAVGAFFVPSASAVGSVSTSVQAAPYHAPLARAPAGCTAGAFALVSTFEDSALDSWTSLAGNAPTVSTKVTYTGEPSLKSSAFRGVQVDMATQNFSAGQSFISFQIAVSAARGTGYFGLMDAGHNPVAVVGVTQGGAWAGSDPASASFVGSIPAGTAYPHGWVYLAANLFNSSTKSAVTWTMELFVDRTDAVAANVDVPMAWNYAGALIETTFGTVYYSNIAVTTYEIPIYIPGYNNMMGYGQGSGLLVQLLPAYHKLSAEMTLNSWDTPQTGILSFQINALNLYGTTRSTCGGFFQLGLDLDPNGMISPCYVPGKNCIAHFFLNSRNPAIQPGVVSPAGTHLLLTIEDDVASGSVTMTIVDTSIGRTWTTTFAYGGGPFYGMYTQLEWQPCCSSFPIEQYAFSAVLYNQQITTLTGTTQPLRADYMLPFTLDAPPSWSFTYYQDSILGYNQIA